MLPPLPSLPIDEVLGLLEAALATGSRAVLVAPPGAGKTTRVPLWLLDAPWLGRAKILMLEPRRLAARGAAPRMARRWASSSASASASGRGSPRWSARRPASRSSPRACSRRMILDDPALDGIGAVLFDEFHERSLDADLALALALDAQARPARGPAHRS